MKIKHNPWVDLSVPKNDTYHVVKVSHPGTLPLHWGKDRSGRSLFIIALKGNQEQQYKANKISVKGIDIDLKSATPTHPQRLVLALDKQVDQDLFFVLCNSLVETLSAISDPSKVVSVALAKMKRWKAFMSGRKRKLLTPEEVRGLFSELLFLQFLYNEKLDHVEAVSSWRGPLDSHQDFIFGNTAVEAKSVSGRDRSTVRISSEDQLESVCDNLYLMVYRLSESRGQKSGNSLNELVQKIESEIVDPDANQEFEDRLANSGYVQLPEYDTPRFLTSSKQTYKVVDGFPRIVRSQLAHGVSRVKYEISLERLKPFACEGIKIGEE